MPGLAGSRIPGVQHVATTDGSSNSRVGGKHVRKDFHLDLESCYRHVNLHDAWEEHDGDTTQKFALEDEELEDCEWDYYDDDNN